jgi:hypothetical protein
MAATQLLSRFSVTVSVVAKIVVCTVVVIIATSGVSVNAKILISNTNGPIVVVNIDI